MAAAEMYNRVFEALSILSTMGNVEMRRYLRSELEINTDDFSYIRNLICIADSFLRIQTFHAFCLQSIKECDPGYNSKEIYEENQHTFCKMLAQFIFEKCRLPERTSEGITEQKLYEIFSSLLHNFHLDYAEIIKKLKDNPIEQLPVNTLDILSAFSEFLDLNRNFSRKYIAHNAVIETAISKEIWNIYEVASKIDHVLIDEAQDNNLKQLYIISRFCSDFLMDDSQDKSLFIVGDYKQSIYGFQGASPDAFLAFYNILKQRDPKEKLIQLKIEKSYRSSNPILEFVDSVFADITLCASHTETIQHKTNREDAPGYVEVRPLIKKSDIDAELQLAISIKNTIQSWISNKRMIKAKKRSVKAGDIAILVAHRTAFVDHLYTQLNSADIPVNFTGKSSVKTNPIFDLLINLGKFITYKYDEEALVTILKSPILGWCDDEILKIKTSNKDVPLFHHIENTDSGNILKRWLELYGTTFQIYSKLLDEEIVSRLGRWYGSETDYYIDTFLDNTLEYDCIYDFIYIFGTDDATIRIKNANENGVTISTVHGSKGAQYPIVFVADSNYVPQNRNIFLHTEDGLPILSSEKNIEITDRIKERQKVTIYHEHMRLLYVALTRAEDELYVVGTGEKIKKNSWHELCTNSIIKIGSTKEDGSYYHTNEHKYFDENLTDNRKQNTAQEISSLFNSEQRKVDEDNTLVMGETLKIDKKTVLPRKTFEILRGELIHEILEYIFIVGKPEIWLKGFLENRALALNQKEQDEISKTVLKFVENNSIPSGRREVEVLFAGRLIRMDHVEFKDNEIVIRDYKTGKNREITDTIVQQMRLYQRAMQSIYPEKNIRTEILWI
ncbi:uvrD/REP helicase N-terminal domain protein [Neorickettsia helminthoeca str. Oregon]|uniref:DNA 3'-5' helicase n=1 Tax=Neorickettsia helminthoeca str. Oregon TaxID=1286528 RepID=X5HJW9_9RICK|nr:uvrD/REP helicase N-terminal domain protein [Neorickettsia helminthoeca str. Oregon]